MDPAREIQRKKALCRVRVRLVHILVGIKSRVLWGEFSLIPKFVT